MVQEKQRHKELTTENVSILPLLSGILTGYMFVNAEVNHSRSNLASKIHNHCIFGRLCCLEQMLVFFQEFFQGGGGKIYCFANFFCYANFSFVFGTIIFWGVKVSVGETA